MNDKKISKNREKKEVIVASLAEKVGKAKAMVFANYQGMTHVQLEGLKKTLKPLNAELVIAKNTLLSRALDIKNLKFDIGNSLAGPTATLFAYDDFINPLKALTKVIKVLNRPTIKFGIIEDKLLAEANVVRLSLLPSREVLIAQLVVGMKAPIYGLHRALSWNLTKLVLTLKAIEIKKN